MKKESSFQAGLISEIESRFPGSVVFKAESYRQGLPDLFILWKNKWAALECKRSANAPRQPNQTYYVDLMNRMSFARFVCPENKEEVLDELQRSFGS